MRAWRLARRPYADLSGEGARRFGGRWNSTGRPVIYAAADAALAVLEVRVHLDLPPDLLPEDYVLMALDLDGIRAERLAEMPDDARAFGDAWLAEGRSAVLDVPSALVPESRNVLLNPAHSESARARIASIRPFAFDRRLWLPL